MHTVREALAEALRDQRRVDVIAEYERTGIAPLVPGAPG
jgi:hypothetical protein